jgi:hypothetical protein
MRANYGLPLRAWLKEQCIEEIIDFGDLPVFEGVTTYPCIIRIAKNTPYTSFEVTQIKTLDFQSLSEYVKENHYNVNQLALDDKGWSLTNERVRVLLEKLKATGVPFYKYVGGETYRGVLTGFNDAFVINSQTKANLIAEDPKSAELIKPFLAGRDIKKYELPVSDKYLIFARRGINIKEYPAIEMHLNQFKERLMPKPKDWVGVEWNGRKPGAYKWYEIQDAIDYYAEFEKPKIIYPNICKRPEFTLDQCGIYTNQKCFIIPTNNKYLLGLLNSSTTYFLFRSILPKLRGDFYEPSYVYFKDFPIRTINFSNPEDVARHDRMVSLVDQMLSLRKQLKEARTPHEQTGLQRQIEATDGQIDSLVYELYGLTEEEIRIVESQCL